MTLVEKVQELQAIRPPLDPTEMKRRIDEWKSQTNYKAPEPVEVKIDDSTDTKDPIGESENTTGSDSGSGSLSFIETDNPIFSWQKQIKPSNFAEKAPSISEFETYRELVTGLKPDQAGEGEIIKGQGGYEYKYEIDKDKNSRIFYYKKPGGDFVNISKQYENNPDSQALQINLYGTMSELGFADKEQARENYKIRKENEIRKALIKKQEEYQAFVDKINNFWSNKPEFDASKQDFKQVGFYDRAKQQDENIRIFQAGIQKNYADDYYTKNLNKPAPYYEGISTQGPMSSRQYISESYGLTDENSSLFKALGPEMSKKFIGYLINEGLDKDFTERALKGDYGLGAALGQYSNFYENLSTLFDGKFTPDQISNLEITRQADLSTYLNNFLTENKTIQDNKIIDGYIATNPEKFKGLNSVEQKALAKKLISELSWNQDNLVSFDMTDYESIGNYLKNYFPELNTALGKKQQLQNQKIADKQNNGSWTGVLDDTVDSMNQAVTSRLEQFSTFALGDALGYDLSAYKNSLRARDLVSAGSVQQAYITGKSVTVDGKEYILQDDVVYDADTNTPLIDQNAAMPGQRSKTIKSALIDSEETSSSVSAASSVVQIAGATTGLALDLFLTKGVGRVTGLTRSLGLKNIIRLPQARINGMLYWSALGAAQGKLTTYQELMNNGVNSSLAAKLSDEAAVQTSIIYGAAGVFSPTEKYFNAFNRSYLLQDRIKKVVAQYTAKGNKKSLSEILKSLLPTKSGTAQTAYNIIGEEVEENLQEFFTQEVINEKINKTLGRDVLDDEYSTSEFVTTNIVSAGVSFSATHIKVPGSTSNYDQLVSSYYAMAQNPSETQKALNNLVENGEITTEQSSDILKQVRAVYNQSSKIPNTVSSETLLNSSLILQDISDLESRLKNIDPAFQDRIKEKIQEKREELSEIVKPELEKSLSRVGSRKKAEEMDVGFENFENQNDLDSAAETLTQEGFKVENTLGYGMSLLHEDGRRIVLINDQVAGEDNVYTTDQHEVLHPFFEQALKGDPELAITFGKALMNHFLSEKGKSIIGGEEFIKRFSQYVNDKNYTAEMTWSEVIPLMSEALSKGDVKYTKENKGWWDELKSQVSSFFNKSGLNITFDTGKDIFDFLAAYNESTEAGKGWSEAQKKIMKEGAKGELVTKGLKTEGTYVLKENETIQDVANKFDITVKELQVINKTSGSDLKAGDEIIIDAAAQDVQNISDVLTAQEIAAQQDDQTTQPLKQAASKRIDQTEETPEQAIRNKELMQKIVDGDVSAANTLVQENSGLILPLLNFNPDITAESGVTSEDILQAVSDMMTPGMVDLVFTKSKTGIARKTSLAEEYAKEKGEVSTFLGRLAQRKKEIYTAAGLDPNKFNLVAIDSSTKQIIDEGSDPKPKPEKEVATTQVDPRKFGPVTEGTKLKDVEGIVKVTDKERLTFRKLASKYFDKVSQALFGMPGKKVKGNASLKYADVKGQPSSSEAGKLQNVFKNVEDVRSFIKAMPPYNVATSQTVIDKQGKTIDVSKDIKGRSIAINPTVLKKFYQPVTRAIEGISNESGRSLGSTSQTQVYELKPEYRGRITKATIEGLQKSLGINKGELSVPIKGPARTEFGSILTGLSKMYVDNLINTVGRSKLTTDQAKADTGAGKSKAMAAKRIKINTKEEFTTKQLTTLGELSSLRSKKQLADKLDFDSPAINEKSRPALQTKMLEAVKTYKLDNAVIEAGVMASGGKQTFYGKKGGKMYSSAKSAVEAGIKNPIKFGKTTDGKFLPINTPGITNWVAKPGRLYYGKSDPAYKDLLKSAKIYDGPKPKKIIPSRAFSTNPKTRAEALQESKDNMKVLDHVVTKLADAVADGMPLEIAGDIIIQSYQATSGLIKIAAPFKYRSKVFRYGGPDSKKQQREGKKYREEHNPPASVVGAEIMFAIKNNASKPIMQAIKDNYYQTQLSKFDDALLDEAKLDATLVEGQTIFDNPISRLAAAGINLQSLENPFTGKTIAQDSGVGIDPKIYNNLNRDQQEQASAIQNQQIIEGLSNPELDVKKSIDLLIPLAEGKARESKRLNNGLSPNSLKYDGFVPIDKVITDLGTADKALNNARRSNAPVKKIRVFDFDDTLAKSKSMVIVTMPDNTTSKINATQFAAQAADLQAQGAEFDFSEFSKVVEGKKGPLFDVAEKIAKARGTDDIFILTARPANAAGPIQAFMKANGINIPLNNITGLGDGTPEAKARWIAGKAAEGYNDFYFADDAIKNVKAVKDVLSQIDVKSKVQQARASKRNTFDTIVNDMIESSSGIESYKTFSAAKARTIGRDKGRFDWLTMSSSAEDFKGLLYRLLGNGKKGEAQFEFLKNNLIDPYNRAEDSIIQAKISASNDFMALKQKFPGLPKTLETETGIGKFTYQHALRVYIWTKQGMSIPGISKADATKLNKFITGNTKLQSFADQLITIQKDKPYPEPGKEWLGGNLTTDIIGGINKVNRAEYQREWQENVDIIFSPENLNKMEAAYGTRWRKALENSLKRMKAGTNRLGYNDSSNAILDWVNNSVGAVMFLNTRSALLQTISAVNFLNWGDNNIIKAGQAFANQKQYWSDFITLMNSDFLVQRRNGLKINVSESEIADAVKDSQNKPKAAIAFLLSKGFVFTRYADSFAIASGGSTFYRNRIKKYLKEGMDQKLAEQKAFEDFKDVAEESQQSSDPSKISMQQASGAGRVILNWANTPMQYVRIQKRALQDLIAGRGDAKVHISRIAYYGVVQNLIFNALQQALFAIGFGDDDEDDEKKKKAKDKKIARVANGMIDSQLKGLGISGMIMLSAKNTLMKIYEESKQKRPEYEAAAIEALSFSPAISSKYRKFVGGLKSFSWNMKEIKEKGFSLDNPAYLAGAQIITAFTNLPIDRVMKKANNIRGILSEQSQMWQKVSMALGYSSYDVGLPYYGGWDKPVEPTEEEIKQQEFDKLKKDTKTQDQIEMLLKLGLTKKEIRDLGKENDRVKKIIELQNAEVEVDGEKVEIVKPKETNEEKLKRQFDSIKSENKPDQVKTLTKFGLSKKQIRNLRYEKDRVEKILELMNK